MSARSPAAVAPGTETLARRLQRERPELSFTRLKRAIERGQVTVDGQVTQEPGRRVGPQARVELDLARPVVARPTRRLVELVHADADVVVAAKPAGLLTVPTPSKEQDTLLSRVSLELARRAETRPYVGVVHRLDKETSGLVAFAASKRAHESLQRQFANHSAGRVYEGRSYPFHVPWAIAVFETRPGETPRDAARRLLHHRDVYGYEADERGCYCARSITPPPKVCTRGERPAPARRRRSVIPFGEVQP